MAIDISISMSLGEASEKGGALTNNILLEDGDDLLTESLEYFIQEV